MFRAIGKYARAVWYLVTFRIDKASETLRMNPGVVSANYDRIIQEKRARINQYKDAIAAMVAQEETKKHKLKGLTEEIQRLEKLKSGAAAKAQQVAAKYNGDPEATRNDPEYLKCQAAFKDFTSTLAEKQSRVGELEADLIQLMENVNRHKVQIQSQMRDLEKLAEEKHDAVATILSAKEEKEIADLVSGIGDDKTSEELRELRELRQKASAGARVSRELAGLDTKQAENDFLQYASDSKANDEFDALIGIAQKPDTDSPATEKTRIPEG
jgi:chromosome segregation ATPase